LLPEGASNALALTALGLAAVGRPNNRAGVEHLAALLAGLPSGRQAIVVGDFDPKPTGDWPGRDGAVETAAALAARLGPPVHWGLPPEGIKDVRKWALARRPDPAQLDEWQELGQELLRNLAGRAKEAAASVPAAGWRWRPIDSATFAATDYRQ